MTRTGIAAFTLALVWLAGCAPERFDVAMRVEASEIWDLLVRVDPQGEETHYRGSGLTMLELGTWDEPHCVGGWIMADSPTTLILLRDEVAVAWGKEGTVWACILRKGHS